MNAFIHGYLDGEAYLENLSGFVPQGKSFEIIFCLQNSLYDLKQSPKTWLDRLIRSTRPATDPPKTGRGRLTRFS